MAGPTPHQRHLDVEGTHNMRDIGGYETSGGRRTRWRTLFRSDSLHRLSPTAQTTLLGYGIKTVVDLRTNRELQSEPNVFAHSSAVAYHHLGMVGDETEPMPPEGLDVAERIAHSYSGMLDRGLEPIGKTLKALAAPDALPALYHCAGGQDRTGLITALLLGIAGVSAQTIAEDYTLTAEYAVNAYLGEDAPPGTDPARYTVEAYRARNCLPEGMIGTIQYLHEHYGGMEGYARAAGLDNAQIETLRQALVD